MVTLFAVACRPSSTTAKFAADHPAPGGETASAFVSAVFWDRLVSHKIADHATCRHPLEPGSDKAATRPASASHVCVESRRQRIQQNSRCRKWNYIKSLRAFLSRTN